MIRSSNFQFKFSVCAVAPCVAVLCLSHPSCCQRADACGFERLVECASVGHSLGSHGSLVSDPACEQLAGCARDVAGPAKTTGALAVVERSSPTRAFSVSCLILCRRTYYYTCSVLVSLSGTESLWGPPYT
jgi:hypothetical protein